MLQGLKKQHFGAESHVSIPDTCRRYIQDVMWLTYKLSGLSPRPFHLPFPTKAWPFSRLSGAKADGLQSDRSGRGWDSRVEETPSH